MQHLTRLKVQQCWCGLDADALAGKTQLQHLEVVSQWIASRSHMALGQLLSNMQDLQQLTYLSLKSSLDKHVGIAPAAAFSALTASSRLRHFDVSGCTAPVGVWQHMFSADRQLPHLRELDCSDSLMHDARHHTTPAEAPDGMLLVSCCPRLQSLLMGRIEYSAALLAQLTGLSSLHTLSVRPADPRARHSAEGLSVVCQLTQLKQLTLVHGRQPEGLLLQLAQLHQLTALEYMGVLDEQQTNQNLKLKVRVANSGWTPLV
jgi:hypothetical protein